MNSTSGKELPQTFPVKQMPQIVARRKRFQDAVKSSTRQGVVQTQASLLTRLGATRRREELNSPQPGRVRGSNIFLFPVRPEGQGSLCVGTPLGEGSGEMVRCAANLRKVEVMRK